MWFADFDPVAMMGLMVPILALAIPVVAILTKHQRQMAELIHGSQGQAPNQEIAALREEVGQLRAQMNSLTLALDSVQTKQATLVDRIGQVQDRA